MVDLIEGDVLDRDFLKRACQGCWAAYYLVHSMKHEARDFAGTDRSAALNMVWAAGEAGLNRMIYLGGWFRGAGLEPSPGIPGGGWGEFLPRARCRSPF